jgi:hypothetical protein
MAATSQRAITITYSGDVGGVQDIEAAENDTSPASIVLITLSSGANTITVPSGGSTPTACTIELPSDNTVAVTLKGVTGDTGILLHLTDPTSIAIDPSVTSFVLTAGGTITGVRVFWS